MKVTVDLNAAMTTAFAAVLEDMEFPPKEIELTNDPNDFLQTYRTITRDYKEEFLGCLETQFISTLSKNIYDQLAEYGITIVLEDI